MLPTPCKEQPPMHTSMLPSQWLEQDCGPHPAQREAGKWVLGDNEKCLLDTTGMWLLYLVTSHTGDEAVGGVEAGPSGDWEAW